MAKTETKATEYDFFRVLQEECSIEDFRQIIQNTVERAKNGCHESRMFLAAYAIGTPPKTSTKLSTLDLSERMDAQSNELLGELFPGKKKGR